LACGFCGFYFWWINRYLKIFSSIRVDKCPSCPPYFPWHTYTTIITHYTNYCI
jgi:hypothetical protein